MLPVELTVSAFGPFAQQETINFEKFYQYDLMLINGPTGAGKTSILDALCFALFGETTSQISKKEGRDPKSMISHFATEGIESFVRFRFCVGQKSYEVHRTLGGLRPKKKGEGFVEIKPTAYLKEFPEGFSGNEIIHESARPMQVTRCISEILGIGVDQFRQVAILPQGKFKEFLTSDSGEKEKILNNLFETHIFSRLVESIKKDESDYEKKLSTIHQKQAILFESVNCESEEEISIKERQLIEEKQVVSDKLKDLEKEILEKTKLQDQHIKQREIVERLSNVTTRIETLETQKQSMESLANKIDLNKSCAKLYYALDLESEILIQKNTLQESIGRYEIQRESCQVELKKSEESLKSYLDYDTVLENKTKALSDIVGMKERIKKSSMVQGQIQLLTKKRDELGLQTHKLSEKEESLSQLLTNLENSYRTNVKNKDEAQEKINQLSDINLLRERFNYVIKIDNQLSEEEEKLKELKSRLENYRKKRAEGEEELLRLDDMVSKNHATALASNLKEGDSCPVCGSDDHPHLAKDDLIYNGSKISLNELTAKISAYTSEINECAVNVKNAEWEIDKTDKHLRDLSKQRVEMRSNLESSGIRSKEDLELLVSKSNDLKSRVRALISENQSIQSEGSQLRQNHAEIKSKFKIISEDYKQCELELEKLKGVESSVEESMTYEQVEANERKAKSDLDSYRSSYKILTDKKVAVESELAKTRALLEEANISRERFQERLNSIEKEISDQSSRQTTNIDELIKLRVDTDELLELENSVNSYNQDLRSAYDLSDELKRQRVELPSIDLNELRDRISILDDEKSQTAENVGAITERLARFSSVKAEYSSLVEAFRDEEKIYKKVSFLSKCLSGGSDTKLNLSRFALAVIFEQIVESATNILNRISRGRYVLMRSQTQRDKRKSFGLDIEVFDEYTGQRRDVRTLSGGESFLASLALALGLSELVQESVGGVRLDMLFIDEGFGSLDTDSLGRVVDALKELGRLASVVGIITHVEDLKSEIIARVDVQQGPQGSTIELVAP